MAQSIPQDDLSGIDHVHATGVTSTNDLEGPGSWRFGSQHTGSYPEPIKEDVLTAFKDLKLTLMKHHERMAELDTISVLQGMHIGHSQSVDPCGPFHRQVMKNIAARSRFDRGMLPCDHGSPKIPISARTSSPSRHNWCERR